MQRNQSAVTSADGYSDKSQESTWHLYYKEIDSKKTAQLCYEGCTVFCRLHSLQLHGILHQALDVAVQEHLMVKKPPRM